jgi:hypothetical protein
MQWPARQYHAPDFPWFSRAERDQTDLASARVDVLDKEQEQAWNKPLGNVRNMHNVSI